MKKLVVIVIVAFTSNIFCIDAQNLIAVQNSNAPKFYTSLDSAVVHSVNGDTIYIPGGNFALNTNISKRLHIIGVGHNPDSTLVTNPTNITNGITLITGASGGSLMGVKINGPFQIGTTSENGKISNYSLARCYIVGFISNLSSYSTNNLFYENIIVTANGNNCIFMSNASSNYFYNNIFSGNVNGASALKAIGVGSIFKNNIFIDGDGFMLNLIFYSIFENNIIRGGSIYFDVSNGNILNNNLFVNNVIFPIGNSNTGSNNIVNQTASSIFVNQSGNTFSYTQDYHLQPTCPGKNAGRDGTDVGIYGGMYPWKAGSIPSNPHIQSMKIAPQTDANGSLNVNIKVKAQDN
jgi:hypothetical protein